MLIAENFAGRLKQANLVTKTGFDKNLTSFNRKITSYKTRPKKTKLSNNKKIIFFLR